MTKPRTSPNSAFYSKLLYLIMLLHQNGINHYIEICLHFNEKIPNTSQHKLIDSHIEPCLTLL